MRAVFALLLLTGTAAAGRHVVEPGETLEHVAKLYGCSVEVVLRANGFTTTLVMPGTIVEIPSCTLRSRSVSRRPHPRPVDDPDALAKEALATIDGTAVVHEPSPVGGDDTTGDSESVGEPWHGRLVNGEPLPPGEGYRIRRPQRSFGASHVVTYLRHAIAAVRGRFPKLHTLAIGDLSAEEGGKIGGHASHQSGLDVDIGFYFKSVPAGYPDAFVAANSELDYDATWALLSAFAKTTDNDDGVNMIFLDYGVQERLYNWAIARGTPKDELEYLFQYPRGKDDLIGVIRHWPGHTDHFHVRFKAGR